MTCTAFSYSGCGGNGNRFETRDQCERQCGEFKGVGKCWQPGRGGDLVFQVISNPLR